MKIIEYGGFIPSVNSREVSRQRNEQKKKIIELDLSSRARCNGWTDPTNSIAILAVVSNSQIMIVFLIKI